MKGKVAGSRRLRRYRKRIRQFWDGIPREEQKPRTTRERAAHEYQRRAQ